MISATDIGEIIRNPALLSKHDPAEIAQLRDKYPYCSSLHLIYLKSVSLQNDVQFEDHLRFAAAHIMDREQMYHFIHSGIKDSEEISSINISTPPPINADNDTTAATLTVQPVIEEASISNAVKTDSTENLAEADDNVVLTSRSMEDLIEAAPDIADIAYEASLNELLVDKGPVIEKLAVAPEQTDDEENSTPPANTEKTVAEEKNPEDLSFVEWLRLKQSGVLPKSGTTLPQGANTKTADIPAKEDTQADSVKKDKKAGLTRLDVDALLNKFIKEEPSISRPQADFYNPVKNAKQSLEESPDLVTETLAKIYVLQKNYSKAIQAYEQLSLVYPEKKTFFATQIKKIKDDQTK